MDFLKKMSKLEIAGVACLALFTLFLFLGHTYQDILVTARQSVDFWYILFSGDFFDFYILTNDTPIGNDYYSTSTFAAYNILLYVVFAVWNIPLALLESFANVDIMNNFFCLVWMKLILVVFLLYSIILLKKILEYIGTSVSVIKLSLYLYCSSFLVIGPLVITSQYDIISVAIALLGFYYYLKKDNNKFLMIFGFAICMKPFNLLILVPLIILQEKRIIVIIKKLMISFIPMIATSLPFIFNKPSNIESFLIYYFFDNNIGLINLFAIAYTCLLFYCYITNPKTNRELCLNAIWVSFVGIASFLLLCNTYPYWIILFAPYLVLIIATNTSKIKSNILLETFACAALTISLMFRYEWVYIHFTMKSMLWSYIFPAQVQQPGTTINYIIAVMSRYPEGLAVINSVSLAGFILFALYNMPSKNSEESNELVKVGCEVLVFRFIAIVGVFSIPFLSLFV